jgi:hypothetical protein
VAADPLRPSAGGAEPKFTMSDALCRPAVLPQELHLPRSHLLISPCGKTIDEPPRQNQSHAVGLGTTRILDSERLRSD